MIEPVGIATDLKTRLAATPCPRCGCRRLELLWKCDVHPKRCLFFAGCGSCRTQYLVDRDASSSRFAASLPEESLTRTMCPACGHSERFVVLHCTPGALECEYEVRCPSCRKRRAAANVGPG
ncbi:MAG: hypothetical protein WEF99_03240 [Thermoanaerobaculia bacterium]